MRYLNLAVAQVRAPLTPTSKRLAGLVQCNARSHGSANWY